MGQDQIHDIGRRRAWLIWLVSLAVYVLAVFHRSSLGVAGLLASERFDITATELGMFTVLQLLVYAGLQVPVGVLLDRFGSRLILLTGLALMTLGQLLFAFTTSFPVAVAARAMVGAGDATVFTAVIRLVGVWFLVRQTSMVTQLTGLSGQLGAVAAATPLSLALHRFGWTPTFALASSVGLVLMVAVSVAVKDSPYRRRAGAPVKLRALARSVRTVWGNPGTRLGMWTHFTTNFATVVFALLWGFPFLVRGQGWSEGEASVLLMAMTGWMVASGLVLGMLVARLPYHRTWIVTAIVAAMAAAWAAVLLNPDPSPVWLVVGMAFVTASGGPASLVGFDHVRAFMPVHALGRANGIVNVGGFVSALVTMALIGVVLDLVEPGGMEAYTLADFRWAMSVQFLFWGLGLWQVWRARWRALAHLRSHHPGAVEQLRAGSPWLHPGSGDEGL